MRSPIRVLLTGASGFLGQYVVGELRARRVWFLIGARRGGDLPLDLLDPQSLRSAVLASGATVVLNLAAMARLGDCERDPAGAEHCNVAAVARLAEGLRDGSRGRLIQVSTDLVFGGDRAPYGPGDPPDPRSVYGSTKADGEAAALAAGGVVVRVPLLFGRSCDGQRGATDMVRRAVAGRRELRLFTDEFRTPIHAADAAAALVDLSLGDRESGVIHVAGPERLSRFELGVRFAARAGLDPALIQPSSSSDPTRPRDVSLRSGLRPRRSLDEMLAGA